MKKDPTVYTQYCVDGTVRMSLHPFDAPFYYSRAPKNFKFKHRVVAKAKYEKDIHYGFSPSCYCFSDKHYDYLKGESGYNEQEIWNDTDIGTIAEKEATEYIDAASLNWLLEGEEKGEE